MRKRITGETVEESSSFKTAKDRASDYAENPAKLNDLLDKAARKARHSQGRLAEGWESLMAMLRLLRAYASGSYREIPWSSLISIIATVIYFVMPLDFIPDFILILGFIDDAALLGWILNSVKTDIDNFLEWEVSTASSEQREPSGVEYDD